MAREREREREGIADKRSRDGVCATDKRDGGKVSSGILTVGRVGAWGVAVLQCSYAPPPITPITRRRRSIQLRGRKTDGRFRQEKVRISLEMRKFIGCCRKRRRVNRISRRMK